MSTAKKVKLVRDSFTIPKPEYAAIDALKARGLTLGLAAKKSEILRAGLMVLNALDDAGLKVALSAVPAVKTGRPRVEALEMPPVAAQEAPSTAKATRKRAVKTAATTAGTATPRARRAPAATPKAPATQRSKATAAPATPARKTTRAVKVAK